ncbi:MAG: DUF4395 domain-containing protein [Bacteroidales bacterium]|jgi:hypothetical protein|nr:DUF4395 domain-containing protein [Bacteroidales bacterium]
MNKYATCPISTNRINERVARLNGLFTFLLIMLFIITRLWYIPAFLAFDFLMRSINLSKFSPLAYLSKGIVKLLQLKKKFINAGPKIFAARIGLLVSSAIFIFSLIGFNITAIVLASVLALFSFLETAFGFCVACEMYPYLNRFLNRLQ